MAIQTKEQIANQRKALAEQLKRLEEEEKNFDKKEEGFKKLEELQTKFEADTKKIAGQFHITDDDLKAFFGPKIVIAYFYESAGVQKLYEWYKGKIGKAPKEWELVKSQGAEAVKQHLTTYGKEWIATEAGKKDFDDYMTVKPKKTTK